MVAFWFNPITNAVVTPSGTQTPGACSVAEFPPFSIGSETISFDDSTVFTLTPISGSVYAVATPRGGAINFTVDGTTPSVVTHYAGDTQEIKLQIEDEILDFQ
jgi:hypothetical protein